MTEENIVVINLPAKKFSESQFSNNLKFLKEATMESYETKDDSYLVKYNFEGQRVIFKLNYDFYSLIKNLDRIEGLLLLHGFISISPTFVAQAIILTKEGIEEEPAIPEVLFNDIQKDKIVFSEPKIVVEPEPSLKQISPKKEASPEKPSVAVDTKEQEIKELESQLSITQRRLEQTQSELERLQKKPMNTLEGQDITILFHDFDVESELEKEYEEKVEPFSDSEKKEGKDFLWSIAKKAGRKISTESLTRLILTMKWEIMMLKKHKNQLIEDLDSSTTELNQFIVEKEKISKELEDKKAELSVRVKTISDWTGMKIEDMDKMQSKPELFGHLMKNNQYSVMKLLSEKGKLSYSQMRQVLVEASVTKCMSNATLTANIKSLVILNWIVHNPDKSYQLSSGGLRALQKLQGG